MQLLNTSKQQLFSDFFFSMVAKAAARVYFKDIKNCKKGAFEYER